jgi:hypothetical protein
MSGCCANKSHEDKHKLDYLLIVSASFLVIGYVASFFTGYIETMTPYFTNFAMSVRDILNDMWIGMVFGLVMVGVLSFVPREFVISALGDKTGFKGSVRAAIGGVLLDLCSHGILLVAAKLYERGASIGQVMAFIVASPWNSFSLTLILWAMIGLKWTLLFILISMVIAVITGTIFDALVDAGKLPKNPNKDSLPHGFKFWPEAKKQLKETQLSGQTVKTVVKASIHESRMVLRWLFFGMVAAAAIRAFIDPQMFQTYFGPTVTGLGLTLLFATILEVCSEGSAPIGADIVNRAGAPGNGLAFLMTGVSTDYTEIMVLKETTKSWKIALFLPLITVPQIILFGVFLNMFGV